VRRGTFRNGVYFDNVAKGSQITSGCCGHGHEDVIFDGMSSRFRRALWAVIAINAVMFVVEMLAGVTAGSMALQADALDFLGDTVTYAVTLCVLGRPIKVRATAALVKGLSLAMMGVWVLGSTAYQVLVVGMPEAMVMSLVGVLAFCANLASVGLLFRFRDGDANVRSVWLCSRNDAIGNVAVVIAAGAVWFTGTAWPDLLVAGLMASLFLWSAAQIIGGALGELSAARRQEALAPGECLSFARPLESSLKRHLNHIQYRTQLTRLSTPVCKIPVRGGLTHGVVYFRTK
jgi:Co/Zn/Cd efflux system component